MNHSEWSSYILGRDGKCTMCGTRENLHAHHIKPQALFPELRFDYDNGTALCAPCHRVAHKERKLAKKRQKEENRRIKALEKIVAWQEARIDELNEEVRTLNLKVMGLDVLRRTTSST